MKWYNKDSKEIDFFILQFFKYKTLGKEYIGLGNRWKDNNGIMFICKGENIILPTEIIGIAEINRENYEEVLKTPRDNRMFKTDLQNAIIKETGSVSFENALSTFEKGFTI